MSVEKSEASSYPKNNHAGIQTYLDAGSAGSKHNWNTCIDWKSFGDTHPNADLQPTIPLDAVSIDSIPENCRHQNNMSSSNASVRIDMKTCPVCKTHLFADMDTCYNCMYLFGSNPALEKRIALELNDSKRERVLGKAAETSKPISSSSFSINSCACGGDTAQEAVRNFNLNPHSFTEAASDGQKMDLPAAIAKDADDSPSGKHVRCSLERELLNLANNAMKKRYDKMLLSDASDTSDDIVSVRKNSQPSAYPKRNKETSHASAQKANVWDVMGQNNTNELFGEFLIKFESFLRDFLIDSNIGIK